MWELDLTIFALSTSVGGQIDLFLDPILFLFPYLFSGPNYNFFVEIFGPNYNFFFDFSIHKSVTISVWTMACSSQFLFILFMQLFIFILIGVGHGPYVWDSEQVVVLSASKNATPYGGIWFSCDMAEEGCTYLG